MKLTFVGHAGALVEAGSMGLLMDPWLKGEAFNDSWALHPKPVLRDEDLARVTHLWVSHGHPDHLSIATLKGLPSERVRNITALFQQHYSPQIAAFLKGVGFKEVIELPHAKMRRFDGVELYCRQVGHLDSSLAIRAGGRTILNLNDCDAPVSTLRKMRRDIGSVDLLMDQFSIAGWAGNPDDTEGKNAAREGQIERLLTDAKEIDPRYVLPFASFVRFSHRENAHLNENINTVDDIARVVDAERLVVMYPGDSWDLERPFAGTAQAMERYREDFRCVATLPTKVHEPVPLKKLTDAADARVKDFQAKYHKALLGWIPPVTFYLDDLSCAIEVDVRKGVRDVELSRDQCMVSLSSQALWYAFAFRWGLPTLGVSGRFVLRKPERPFFRLKKLGSLYAEGLYTRRGGSDVVPSSRLIGYLWRRRGDLRSQFLQRVV
jgi:hypothetical protein